MNGDSSFPVGYIGVVFFQGAFFLGGGEVWLKGKLKGSRPFWGSLGFLEKNAELQG